MEDRQLSLSEVAGLMGVSERTVRRWIKAGRLRAFKPGRDYRIPESAVRQLVEESEVYPKGLMPPTLFNGLLEERRRPTERNIKALHRWLTYNEHRLTEGNLSRDEIGHELDAPLAFEKPISAYPDELFNRFLQLMRRALAEGKSFDALQAEVAAIEADMNRLELAHEQAKERQ